MVWRPAPLLSEGPAPLHLQAGSVGTILSPKVLQTVESDVFLAPLPLEQVAVPTIPITEGLPTIGEVQRQEEVLIQTTTAQSEDQGTAIPIIEVRRLPIGLLPVRLRAIPDNPLPATTGDIKAEAALPPVGLAVQEVLQAV